MAMKKRSYVAFCNFLYLFKHESYINFHMPPTGNYKMINA
jgi:hypothetical protein